MTVFHRNETRDPLPEHLRGGNGYMRYADTEAVRVLQPPPCGIEAAMREAWARYQIPVAVTEVHNGCTRDEQMRWTAAAWDAAVALREEGIPIVAVTSWALLGSAGWSSLLTEPGGRYECGVFDVSGTGAIFHNTTDSVTKDCAGFLTLPNIPGTGGGTRASLVQ